MSAQFYRVQTIYELVRGQLNTVWRTAGWGLLFYCHHRTVLQAGLA